MLDLDALARLLPYVDGPRWEEARKAYWEAAPKLLALARAGRRLAEAEGNWMVACRNDDAPDIDLLESKDRLNAALAEFREADGG